MPFVRKKKQGDCESGKREIKVRHGERAGSKYCRKDTGPTVKWLRQQLKEKGQGHKTKQGTSIWKAKKPLLLRMYQRRIVKGQGEPPQKEPRRGRKRRNLRALARADGEKVIRERHGRSPSPEY